MYSAIVEIRVRHLESPHGKKKKERLSKMFKKGVLRMDYHIISPEERNS